MIFLRAAPLAALFLAFHTIPLPAETVRLSSGKEVRIIDGQVPGGKAEELYREAEGFLKTGRLGLAGEYWQLIIDKARGGVVSRAREARGKIKKIEYGSLVVLKNGKILRGKVGARLRSDRLGLEGKEAIPIWQIKEITAEYHPGYSFVSKSFYPMTLLEIKMRGRDLQSSRVSGEIEFTVEGEDGSVSKAVLGKSYELLRSENLGKQLEGMIADRIVKIVIYPDLR